jgi:saccharopine dehydrogenase-like NADP-dependent oxidoreductase
MYNTITGELDGSAKKVEYFMWEEANDEFSAMARVTGFPAAIAAKMIGTGRLTQRGIRAPEECFVGDNYQFLLDELEACDIQIAEVIQPIETKERMA